MSSLELLDSWKAVMKNERVYILIFTSEILLIAETLSICLS